VDLALARMKTNLGQLRGPVQRSTDETLKGRIGGRVKLAHLRYYLGAALFAALVGIGVNALLLQRERHPAPLFGYATPTLPTTPAPAPPTPPQKSVSTEDAAPPAPPALPATALPPARAQAAGGSSSGSDPIAELLAGEPRGDSSHLTLAAQTALAKLGYPVKPDGKVGSATEQALREFEHAHGLPPATEITERLVKQLTAAARAGTR
jgi:Putative peptidoglycan binding domain